jgi:hypothetical protein
MWFLLRTAFWFSMVLVMLPIFDQDATDRLKKVDGVELTDAFGAAAGAITYMGSLCAEKPDVCVKGAETFSTLGARAREGARVAYSYLDEKFADPAEVAAADSVTTGTVTTTEAAPETAAPDDIARHIPIPTPRPAH